MTVAHLIAEVKAVIARWEANPVVGDAVNTVVTDIEAAGSATASYVKTKGYEAAYQIALTLVGGMVPGANWLATLASIVEQVKAAGLAIEQGAEAILAAQAQADLLAVGKAAGLPTA